MPRSRSSPTLVLAAMAVVLIASVAGGWLVAAQVAGGESHHPIARADPAEPTYDAEDPAAEPVSTTPAATTAQPAAAASLPEGRPSLAAPASAPQPTPVNAVPMPVTALGSPTQAVPAPGPASTTPDAPALTPYDPPPAIGIAASALPPEGKAWSILTASRRAAPDESQERADLDWLVSFAREAAAPQAPTGRRETARRALRVNAWWYQRRASPDARVIARDPDGVIHTYKRGHGFMVNPVATIGRWRSLNELWSPVQLADTVLPMLAERSAGGTPWAALEYFDVPGEPSAVRPGVSAMGQARGVGLFARAWSATGDSRFLDAARRLLESFAVPVDAGGVLARVSDPGSGQAGAWYPERAYPGADPWMGGALNGFMVTLIELDRAAVALGSAPEGAAAAATARDLVDRGRRSLVRFLPLHDSGDWSYYGLLTPGKAWRSYLADLNYHCYHVSLLRTLDRLGPADGLGRVADRWQAYVDARAATCPAR